jgi:hypothetical protein
VGPADKTGKSSVTYWPGGRVSLARRRLPTNPGVVGDDSSISFNELLTDFAKILPGQIGLRTDA